MTRTAADQSEIDDAARLGVRPLACCDDCGKRRLLTRLVGSSNAERPLGTVDRWLCDACQEIGPSVHSFRDGRVIRGTRSLGG